MNRTSVVEWHKRFKEGRETVRDDERCGRSKGVRTLELIGQSVRVKVTVFVVLREFRKRFRRKRPVKFIFANEEDTCLNIFRRNLIFIIQGFKIIIFIFIVIFSMFHPKYLPAFFR